MDNINNFIIRLWQSGDYTEWKHVAKVVNKKYGTDLSGQSCRGRYRRGKGEVSTPNEFTPEPDAAAHNYQLNIPIENSHNILVISDLHNPFAHPNAIDFCAETYRQYKCDTVVFIGDIVDEHALSVFDSDPDGYSAGHEANRARESLQDWYNEFPNAYVCIGNHDDRPMRKMFSAGVPKRYIRSFSEIWDTPVGWTWGLSFVANGVVYEHGTQVSGIHAAYNRSLRTGRKTVIGHTHIAPGVKFLDQDWWAMGVGCLIDVTKYAMLYGRGYNGNVVLGCGVVLDGGRQPIFVPMR